MATGGAGTGLLNVPCGAELSAPLAAPLVAPSTTDGSTVQAGGPLHAPEAADRAGTASEEPPIVPAAVAAIGDAGTGAGAPAATALSGHSAAPIGHPSVAALPAGGLNVPSAAGAAGAAASASAAAAAAAWNVPCDATDASSTAAVALNLPVPVGADAAELEHRQAAAALWVSKPPAVSAPLPLAADAPVADHKVKLVKLATDTHVSKWIVERLVLSSSLKFLCRLGSKSIACHIFDPPSQQKYHSIQLAFLRGAHAVMIAFDVTLRGDLQRARALHRDAVRIVPDVPCVFFGVRVDDTKPVAIDATAGSALAAACGSHYFDLDASTSNEVLGSIISALVRDALMFSLYYDADAFVADAMGTVVSAEVAAGSGVAPSGASGGCVVS